MDPPRSANRSRAAASTKRGTMRRLLSCRPTHPATTTGVRITQPGGRIRRGRVRASLSDTMACHACNL
jgi:hypothetical protein